jgi:SAM-dependent methyltransferase
MSTLAPLEAAIEPWLSHMRWRRDYDQWRERRINQENYQQERLALLERTVGRVAGVRLLDLGAGMGGFAVAAALRGANVVACEYNQAYCSIVALRAARHNRTLPICNTAGEAIPFPANSFDAVVCWDVLEHVQSPHNVLSEIARVLRPGGCALITVINRRAWIDPHYHMRGITWLPPWLAEWIIALRGRSKKGAAFRDMQRFSEMHYFGYDEFVALAARYGFRVRDLREELLREGNLASSRQSRRVVRALLRTLRLEQAAYRWQRCWTMAMFELALCTSPSTT